MPDSQTKNRNIRLTAWHTRVDVTTYLRLVTVALSVVLEFSTSLPLCIQREPLMGTVASVKLQCRTAEVWLMTSDGSVIMFGA